MRFRSDNFLSSFSRLRVDDVELEIKCSKDVEKKFNFV